MAAEEYDPLDLAGQKLTQEKRQEAERLGRIDELDDVRWLMGSRRGRRIVWRLLGQSGVFRVSFSPGDPHSTSFNEGARNQGLKLLAQISEATPALYATMLEEQRKKDDDRKRGSSSSVSGG